MATPINLDAAPTSAGAPSIDPEARRAALRAAGYPVAALSIDPDTLLTRAATAQALTEAGFPTAKATLATKACRGGGPPFQLYGRIPLYQWGTSLAWAQSRLSKAMRTTSEADAS